MGFIQDMKGRGAQGPALLLTMNRAGGLTSGYGRSARHEGSWFACTAEHLLGLVSLRAGFGENAEGGQVRYAIERMARTLLSAAKVRKHRESLGLSQRRAATEIGWRLTQTWYKLELRETDVRISTLVRIARIPICDISDLFVEVPGKPSGALRYRRNRI
jgi:hypothetical protein